MTIREFFPFTVWEEARIARPDWSDFSLYGVSLGNRASGWLSLAVGPESPFGFGQVEVAVKRNWMAMFRLDQTSPLLYQAARLHETVGDFDVFSTKVGSDGRFRLIIVRSAGMGKAGQEFALEPALKDFVRSFNRAFSDLKLSPLAKAAAA